MFLSGILLLSLFAISLLTTPIEGEEILFGYWLVMHFEFWWFSYRTYRKGTLTHNPHDGSTEEVDADWTHPAVLARRQLIASLS